MEKGIYLLATFCLPLIKVLPVAITSGLDYPACLWSQRLCGAYHSLSSHGSKYDRSNGNHGQNQTTQGEVIK